MAGIVIGSRRRLRPAPEKFRRAELLVNEPGDVDGDRRQTFRPRGPVRTIPQVFDKIPSQRHRAGRAGGEHVIGIALQQRRDVLLGQRDGGLPIPRVEGGDPAAVLPFRIVDQHPETVHDLDQGAAQLGIEEIVGATAEQGDPVAESVDPLRNGVPLVAQRLIGQRRQGAPLGERGEEERQVADGSFPTGHRFLQKGGGAQQGVE